MEILVWNSLVHSRPFCLIQEDGYRKTYNWDELSKKGKKYTDAAHEAIMTFKQVTIQEDD